MSNLLSYLPALSCPVVLGLLLWVLLRATKQQGQTSQRADSMRAGMHSQMIDARPPLQQDVQQLWSEVRRLQAGNEALMGQLRELEQPEKASPCGREEG